MSDEFCAHTPSKNDRNNPQTWHYLDEHLQAVARLAEEFATKLGGDKLGYYAGLWHDLGKYNPEFQKYIKNCHAAQQAGRIPKSEKIPHAVYGAILADEICPLLAPLIYGHHAGLPNYGDLESKLNKPQWRKTYQEIIKQAKVAIAQLEPGYSLEDTLTQKPINELSEDVFTRLLFSCLIDADRLDTENFADPSQYQQRQQRATKISMNQLWETFQQKHQEFIGDSDKPKSEVNQIRDEVYQKCLEAAEWQPGVFRLCVPTGGGKTLSGLAFALKHAVEKKLKDGRKSRVIFAVPYTSIIEQTAKVYREDIFGDLDSSAVLEHHSAVRSEKIEIDQAQIESEEIVVNDQVQAKLATQNWDAPLIITTTVQLFESLFSNKTGKCRKLHNIVNSVIVIDEVQTLPIGLLTPILSMLRELVDRYQVTVVLCTATQPALEGDTPYFKEGFPINSVQDIIHPDLAKKHFLKLKRVKYEVPKHGETWTWQILKEQVPQNQSSLIVLNTRRDAVAVLSTLDVQPNKSVGLQSEKVQSILRSEQSSPTLHLSTLLCGEHRRVVLKEVKRRLDHKEHCILVSTQVVEAGVDLDFPLVFRALGPLDRIVQAAGRCNREGKLKNEQDELISGRVVIFDPAEGSKPPKGEYAQAMQKAQSILQDAGFQESDLHEPAIFQQYFRYLYSVCKPDEKGIQAMRKSGSFRDVSEEFKLIEDNAVPVVIEYDTVVRDLLKDIERRGLWSSDREKLQPYMVNLPKYLFNQTKARKEIATDLWQWTGSYDPIFGISWDEKDDVPVYGFLSI
jgi:CRISPR-associated endonuclease/helicase Cas3